MDSYHGSSRAPSVYSQADSVRPHRASRRGTYRPTQEELLEEEARERAARRQTTREVRREEEDRKREEEEEEEQAYNDSIHHTRQKAGSRSYRGDDPRGNDGFLGDDEWYTQQPRPISRDNQGRRSPNEFDGGRHSNSHSGHVDPQNLRGYSRSVVSGRLGYVSKTSPHYYGNELVRRLPSDYGGHGSVTSVADSYEPTESGYGPVKENLLRDDSLYDAYGRSDRQFTDPQATVRAQSHQPQGFGNGAFPGTMGSFSGGPSNLRSIQPISPRFDPNAMSRRSVCPQPDIIIDATLISAIVNVCLVTLTISLALLSSITDSISLVLSPRSSGPPGRRSNREGFALETKRVEKSSARKSIIGDDNTKGKISSTSTMKGK